MIPYYSCDIERVGPVRVSPFGPGPAPIGLLLEGSHYLILAHLDILDAIAPNREIESNAIERTLAEALERDIKELPLTFLEGCLFGEEGIELEIFIVVHIVHRFFVVPGRGGSYTKTIDGVARGGNHFNSNGLEIVILDDDGCKCFFHFAWFIRAGCPALGYAIRRCGIQHRAGFL